MKRLVRKAHFRVEEFGQRFNKSRSARVTIEDGCGHQLVTVRPARSRKAYAVSLVDVAQYVIWEALCRDNPRIRNLTRGRK
jgi:hypothetical protein